MIEFDKIAPYLKDPLVLIGFFIFVVFLLLRILIKQKIIPTLTRKDGFSFLKLLLLYGFLFGIILMTLGFGLKYREMSEKEQQVVLAQLNSELSENLQILNQLKQNTEHFLEINLQLSSLLRTDDIQLLSIMFPYVNIDLDSTENTIELANQSFNYIIQNKLHEDELQMNRLDATGRSIRATIGRTLPTLISLADLEGSRYSINKSIWHTNRDIYKKIRIVDITKFQHIYSEMQLIRNDYDVITSNSIHFYETVSNFFDPEHQINRENLASVLSSERQTYQLVHDYSLNIYYAVKEIKKLQTEIETKSVVNNYDIMELGLVQLPDPIACN